MKDVSSDYGRGRGDGLQSLGSIFREFRGQIIGDVLIPSEPDITLEDLLDPRIVPPRETVERLIEQEVERLAGAVWEQHKAPIRAQIARLERMLRMNDARDALGEDRPVGCWCLGRGWRKLLPQEALAHDGLPVLYCSCEDGARAKAEHDQKAGEHEQQQYQEKINRLWRGSGLPQRFVGQTAKSWLREIAARDPAYIPVAKAALRRLHEWEETSQWLYLEGPVGRGKSALMAILLMRFSADDKSVLYQNAPKLLNRIRQSFNDQTTAEVLASLERVDVLALDDVGKERPNDWTREQFYALINARYESGSRMLCTSNLPIESAELADRLGEAAVDRITQMCGSLGIIRLDGPNLRSDAQQIELPQ